ncbi:type 4a pilus biogenesis protein PilO [Planctomycetota bacterium]
MLTEQLIRLNNRSRFALSATLTLIIVYALYSWMMAPHVTYLRAVQQYVPAVHQVEEEWDVLRATLAEDKEALHSLRNDFLSMRQILFSYDEAKEWFNDLESLAAAQGCAVSTIHMGSNGPINVVVDQEQETLIEGVDAHMTVVGTFNDLLRFVQHVQEQPRRVFVRSLQMESMIRHSEHLTCRLAVTVYMLEEQETDYDDLLL